MDAVEPRKMLPNLSVSWDVSNQSLKTLRPTTTLRGKLLP